MGEIERKVGSVCLQEKMVTKLVSCTWEEYVQKDIIINNSSRKSQATNESHLACNQTTQIYIFKSSLLTVASIPSVWMHYCSPDCCYTTDTRAWKKEIFGKFRIPLTLDYIWSNLSLPAAKELLLPPTKYTYLDCGLLKLERAQECRNIVSSLKRKSVSYLFPIMIKSTMDHANYCK